MKTYLDHVVFIVKDVKKTKEFYNKILGKATYEDKDSIMWQLESTKIFFVHPWKKVTDNSFNNNRIGLNHLAFGVKSRKELESWKEKLDKAGIKCSEIYVDEYGGTCIYFKDPDNIGCEFYLREK